MVTDRGQAFTLEAFMAAILLVGGIIFALQVTAVTPLTASTSSQHIENQQLQVANGLLDAANENGSLREAVLYWDVDNGTFQDSSGHGYYVDGGPPTQFGAMVDRTFLDRGIAFNVNVLYSRADGELRQERMVYLGEPSDHAVSARRTITIYDDDRLTGEERIAVGDAPGYFAPDIAPGNGVYSVLRVEMIVWRM